MPRMYEPRCTAIVANYARQAISVSLSPQGKAFYEASCEAGAEGETGQHDHRTGNLWEGQGFVEHGDAQHGGGYGIE